MDKGDNWLNVIPKCNTQANRASVILRISKWEYSIEAHRSCYLNLATARLLEICCCPQSNETQMLTLILRTKILQTLFSIKHTYF